MKKGFTLIELLAVIVILAIIALIATPIVLSIINDSKESAVIRSAEFYVDAVENKIMQENMKQGGTLSPEECIINSDGNVTCDGTPLEIEVNGEKPTSGSITFDKGLVTNITLTFGDKTVSMNSNGELVLDAVCVLINGKANEIGSKYQCKVKNNMEEGFEGGYFFFVLSHNEDRTANLIMDRNICEDGTIATAENVCFVAWINQEDYEGAGGSKWYSEEDRNMYGPVTAMKYLHNATKSWINIPPLNYEYYDIEWHESLGIEINGGYESFTSENGVGKINGRQFTGKELLRARMPIYTYANDKEYGEVSDYNGSNSYLYDYLSLHNNIQTNAITGIYGYWSSSSHVDDSSSAWFVRYRGDVDDDGVNDEYYNGVRPVINIKL